MGLGDPQTRKAAVADVRSSAVHFWPDLSQFDARHELTVGLAQLDHEAVEAVMLSVAHKISEDQGVGAGIHAGWPPFHAGESGGVDLELWKKMGGLA